MILYSTGWDSVSIHKNNIWLWSETKDLNSAIHKRSNSTVAIFNHGCIQSSLLLIEKRILNNDNNTQKCTARCGLENCQYFKMLPIFKIP